MSDDIVTRLRNKRTEFDNWLNDIEGKHSFGHDESIWLDAADEIERLRAELIQANNQIKLLIAIETSGKNPCSCDPSDDYICFYHE